MTPAQVPITIVIGLVAGFLTMPSTKTATVTVLAGVAILGFLFLAFASSSPAVESATGKAAHNVVLLLIDTLRADHLGCYGYHRNTSPEIDRIASHGMTFSNFYSVSNWTSTTIASLLTGLYPREIYHPGTIDDVLSEPIPEEIDTLAEVLTAAGRRTVALVAHPMIHPKLGFAQGFSQYRMLLKKPLRLTEAPTRWLFSGLWHRHGFSAKAIEKELAHVLDERGPAPFFIYMHVIYPHAPYVPPPPYDTMFGPPYKNVQWYTHIPPEEKNGLINAYDGEIRYTDTFAGNVFKALEDRGLLDSTYLIITSDHGEAFWEHGFYEHGHYYYNEVIRVPLVIYPAGGLSKPLRIDARASNIDLFPTVTDIMAAQDPAGVRGTSLLRFARRPAAADGSRVLFSERSHAADRHAIALIRGDFKYILSPEFKSQVLFNLATDPRETHNLAPSQPDLVRKLHALILDHQALVDKHRASLRSGTGHLDKETLEQIRALGYIK